MTGWDWSYKCQLKGQMTLSRKKKKDKKNKSKQKSADDNQEHAAHPKLDVASPSP